MTNNYDYTFKVAIVGNHSVGKSSIINSLVNHSFEHKTTSTLGVDFNIKTLETNGKHVKLLIWDTAGQERFRSLISAYYRNVHGVILVYDITNKITFADLKMWIRDTDRFCSEYVVRILVGNKSDLTQNREVTYDEGKRLAQDMDMIFIETSAKTFNGIEDAFISMTTEIINNEEANIFYPKNVIKLEMVDDKHITDDCEC